jgi:predicted RNA-binding protein with TRAM domain
VSARAASQQAQVAWTAPDSDGDSPITGYTVTPYAGSTAQRPVHAAASATSATVTGLTNGQSYTFKVTATNDVGDGPGSQPSGAVTPEATIFDFATPPVVDSGDTTSVELGVKFKADHDGAITGIRFYKAEANTGTHVGSLWTAGGTRLAQATFTGETGSGWQTATFSSPVPVTAATTYVASYFAPAGHYSAAGQGLASAVDNPPLHAIGNDTSANGVYAYATASTFPTNTYGSSNYYVDVLYAIPAPGQVHGVTAGAAGRTSATVSWDAPSDGGPVSSYEVTPYVGSTAQTPTTVTGSPPATTTKVVGLTTGTAYTFTVRAVNASGPGPESTPSGSVTPESAVAPSAPTGVAAQPASRSARVTWTPSDSDGDSPITGQTIIPYVGSTPQAPVQAGPTATSATVTGLSNGTSYTFRVAATNGVGTSSESAASSAITPEATIFDFVTPKTVDAGESDPVELGVKFTADYSGSVTGIRFYKAAANTGTHVGTLWTAGGTRLAQVTFTDETAAGWQSATFATPVAITAGTTYVASYYAPRGHYSLTSGGLASGVDSPPLHAVPDGTSPNGTFVYGAGGGFPSGSFNASDYGVDVLFADPAAPGPVTGVAAVAGQSSATVSWTAPSDGGPVSSYRITPYIGSTAQAAKTITGSPPATTATITGLTAGTGYTFTVRAANAGGTGDESAPSNAVTPTGAGVPGAPTGVSADADSTSAVVRWTAPGSDGGSAITGYTVTPYAGTTAQPPTRVAGSATSARMTGLANGTSYTFTVTATNDAGDGAASQPSGAVTPEPSIFGLGTPAVPDSGDTGAVNLGVKFAADVDGSVTGIRFYKAAANTGTHVGALWSATGELLAQGTFTNESDSGWQTVTFSSPVPITAGTTYVASYLAPKGHYSVTGAGLVSGVDNAPLHAVADGTSPNGLYLYGASSAFPTLSFNATNYWVDVLFAPAS